MKYGYEGLNPFVFRLAQLVVIVPCLLPFPVQEQREQPEEKEENGK